jgi:hypothetical protein
MLKLLILLLWRSSRLQIFLLILMLSQAFLRIPMLFDRCSNALSPLLVLNILIYLMYAHFVEGEIWYFCDVQLSESLRLLRLQGVFIVCELFAFLHFPMGRWSWQLVRAWSWRVDNTSTAYNWENGIWMVKTWSWWLVAVGEVRIWLLMR